MQKAKGVRDIFGTDLYKMEKIRSIFFDICKSYNAKYIELPIIEPKELFERSAGDSSDIVQKEMFEVQSDKESLVLRPEGTASVVRAMSENINEIKLPAKLSYFGPMFRKERPQKGRYRQFYQCGIEYIGEGGFGPEIESLLIIKKTLSALNISDYEIQINYLGNIEERAKYKESLVKYFNDNISLLSEDSQRRLLLNPLRILDSKDEKDKKVCENVPSIDLFLSDSTKQSLSSFYSSLAMLDISVNQNPKLVRGLDYYTGIVFEIIDVSNKLGSQTAICGGGRYDGLIKENKISTEGGFGFAFGIDRLMLILDDNTILNPIDISLITTSTAGLSILNNLRDSLINDKFNVDINFNIDSSFKKKFKRSDSLGSKNVLILGNDELAFSFFKIKNLATGEEKKFENVDFNEISSLVKEYLVETTITDIYNKAEDVVKNYSKLSVDEYSSQLRLISESFIRDVVLKNYSFNSKIATLSARAVVLLKEDDRETLLDYLGNQASKSNSVMTRTQIVSIIKACGINSPKAEKIIKEITK